MPNRLLLLAGLLVSLAAHASAQQTATVDPGMTRDQVVARLGQPLSARRYDGFTYLLYKNGCEKTCGMNDLLVLDSDKVVDAVFRSAARHYSGTSSSPRMISAEAAKRGGGGSPIKTPRSTLPLSTSPNTPVPKKPTQ